MLNAVCEPDGRRRGGADPRARAAREGSSRCARAAGVGARTHAVEELCSGPGKLTQALGISLAENGSRLRDGPVAHRCSARRVARAAASLGARASGSRSAVELPWRFCAPATRYVSRPPGSRSRRAGAGASGVHGSDAGAVRPSRSGRRLRSATDRRRMRAEARAERSRRRRGAWRRSGAPGALRRGVGGVFGSGGAAPPARSLGAEAVAEPPLPCVAAAAGPLSSLGGAFDGPARRSAVVDSPLVPSLDPGRPSRPWLAARCVRRAPCRSASRRP